MAAPAIWRRSAALTRKRIESSLPLSRDEIQAQADRVRAEAAMAIRRLEIELKAVREKATHHQANASRQLEQIASLKQECETSEKELASLRAVRESLEKQLEERQEELAKLAREFADACDEIEKKIGEIDRLSLNYQQAALDSSDQQIELVARETRIDQLTGDVQALKEERRQLEVQNRDLSAEMKALANDLKAKERRLADAETRHARMMTDLIDAQERLERREKELERLRDFGKSGSETDHDARKLIETLETEREGLEDRLKKIAAENRRLRTEASVQGGSSPDEAEQQKRENEVLRNRINGLAAEVVHLTALLEGADSKITEIIRPGRGAGAESANPSIADRVRTLRSAAQAR